MCSLPRESRLCFTLVGVQVIQSSTSDGTHRVNVPLGWVTTQVYDQQLYVNAIFVIAAAAAAAAVFLFVL